MIKSSRGGFYTNENSLLTWTERRLLRLFRKLWNLQNFHLKAEMFSFHSKYFVYRELKRAPQKLSFCFKCPDTGTVQILGNILYDKNNLKAVFVSSSCLFTFSLSRAQAYHAMHNSVTGFHYLPFENVLHLSFSMKLTFSARKCH